MKTKLKYFSKKDGWEQYWDILDLKSSEESIHVKAMHSADKLSSRKKVLFNSDFIRNFLFIREYNRYLKEN